MGRASPAYSGTIVLWNASTETGGGGGGGGGEGVPVTVSFGLVECPWDCGDGNGEVDTVDFLALLAEWGMVGTPCDFDGGGVDTVDFLALLANWGACP